MTTAIEESQKVVSDEKTNLLNLQSHNADVYSQIIKLNQERQHASTTVVLDQKEIDLQEILNSKAMNLKWVLSYDFLASSFLVNIAYGLEQL